MSTTALALASALALAGRLAQARLGEVTAEVVENVTSAVAGDAAWVGVVEPEQKVQETFDAASPLEASFGAPIPREAFKRGGAARSPEFWANASFLTTQFAQGEFNTHGHEWIATTTHYENTCCASCGSVDTGKLVQGTDYYAVASAQAMQNYFPEQGECCWCGKAGRSCGHGTGTAGMGCTECAVGRFIRKRPYPQSLNGNHPIFDRTFKLVVADICPHKGNEAWCPPHPGHKNTFGSKNHFDFADPPAGFDNFYFAFTPAPCSPEIERRMRSHSRCH